MQNIRAGHVTQSMPMARSPPCVPPGTYRRSATLSNPEVANLTRSDLQLQKALSSSRRVGSLLLKQEEAEVEKVKQLSEELLKKNRWEEELSGSERQGRRVLR